MTVAVEFAGGQAPAGGERGGGGGEAAAEPSFGQLDPRRRHRLTASMLGDAVGLSKYVTPKLLWQLYTGRVRDERESGSEFTLHGDTTEPVAREMYERMYGQQVKPSGFVIHRAKSWLGATPDGLVGDLGLLEIKAPFYQLYKDIPPHYMAQMQGQLEVCDRHFCDFFVLCTRTQELCVYTVSRSREYWAWIEPLLAEFFACVHADVEPTRLTWPPRIPPPPVPTRCLYRGPVLAQWRTPGFLRRVAEQEEEMAERERAAARVRAEMDVLLVVRNVVDAVCRPLELAEEAAGRAAEREAREAERARAGADAARQGGGGGAPEGGAGGAGARSGAEQGGGGEKVIVVLMDLDTNPREGTSGADAGSDAGGGVGGAHAEAPVPMELDDSEDAVCEGGGSSGVVAGVAGSGQCAGPDSQGHCLSVSACSVARSGCAAL